MVDWRLLVIFYLMSYSTVQASVRPFKLPQESILDSVCVLMIMAIFAADIHKDLHKDIHKDVHGFLVFMTVTGLIVLVVSTVLAGWQTRKMIR